MDLTDYQCNNDWADWKLMWIIYFASGCTVQLVIILVEYLCMLCVMLCYDLMWLYFNAS